MDISLTLFRFWGGMFMVMGFLSLAAGFLGKLIDDIEDKSIIISTGYITMLIGLVTVVLHNVWVWEWKLIITILGWSTLMKGMMKIGWPENIQKKSKMFKKHNKFWSLVIFLMGAGLVWLGL